MKVACACFAVFSQKDDAEKKKITIFEPFFSVIFEFLAKSYYSVSCINVPAGYHNPHKDDEYTLLPELERCMAFVKQVVTTLHQRFPHEYRSETQ